MIITKHFRHAICKYSTTCLRALVNITLLAYGLNLDYTPIHTNNLRSREYYQKSKCTPMNIVFELTLK